MGAGGGGGGGARVPALPVAPPPLRLQASAVRLYAVYTQKIRFFFSVPPLSRAGRGRGGGRSRGRGGRRCGGRGRG